MTFDATINLGTVIQGVVILGGVMAAYFRLDKRLAILETHIKLLPCRGGKDCKEGD